MTRIALIGPGAVGGVIAAWLAQTGRHQLTLCARRPLGELNVDTPAGQLRFTPHVITAPAQGAAVDWVLVATKAYDSAGAAAWLPPLIAAGARVAVLQNGVEHRERFAPFLPAAQILPVMIDCPAERDASGRIRQRGTAKMVVQDDADGRAFAALFAGTPVEVNVTADLKSAVWRKLCTNAAGVISGLLLQPVGVMQDAKLGAIARGIVREVIAVGRAEGAVMKDEWADDVLAACRAAPPDSINSLQADCQAGRPTEIDARNGVVVRFGQRHGIATPYNEMAVALVEAMTRASLARTRPS